MACQGEAQLQSLHDRMTFFDKEQNSVQNKLGMDAKHNHVIVETKGNVKKLNAIFSSRVTFLKKETVRLFAELQKSFCSSVTVTDHQRRENMFVI